MLDVSRPERLASFRRWAHRADFVHGSSPTEGACRRAYRSTTCLVHASVPIKRTFDVLLVSANVQTGLR